jgi:hypothetical protein
MKGMEEAAAILGAAAAARRRIVVFGDYDVDGITAVRSCGRRSREPARTRSPSSRTACGTATA